MNGHRPMATAKRNSSIEISSYHRKQKSPISCVRHGSAIFRGNIGECVHFYQPLRYPRSCTNLPYPSVSYYNHATNIINNNDVNYFSPNNVTMTIPSRSRNWNRINLPSLSATTNASISKAHAEGQQKDKEDKEKLSSPSYFPKSISSNEFIDPNILEIAQTLQLPPEGQKYSVSHWKCAMKLCFRWKTTTNENEGRFYRTCTTINSLSSSNLKSIKFFCEKILKRKSKRRQFAIHWKASGLQKIVEEALSSDNTLFKENDPKIEKSIDDYFSGRTRSTGYKQAQEKALDNRQKEILCLWDELMSGSILSDASSHQKLYLIQLAIERPYRSKKVQIETADQKVIHDVAIEGYGGESYWIKNITSLKDHEDLESLRDPAVQSFDGVLPVNEGMAKRFWKCADIYCNSKRQKKRRRIENASESKTCQQNPESLCTLSKKSFHTREAKQNEDKKNERSLVAPH